MGALALAVKAYAYWRDGKRLVGHGEMWEYIEISVNDVGEWVRDSWYAGNATNICFYEEWCKPNQAKAAMKHIKKLIKEIKDRFKEV